MCLPGTSLSGGTGGGTSSTTESSHLARGQGGFKAKLRWHDGSDGHGEHYFDYNHGGGAPKTSYGQPRPNPPKPAYAASNIDIDLAENRLGDFENLQPFQP